VDAFLDECFAETGALSVTVEAGAARPDPSYERCGGREVVAHFKWEATWRRAKVRSVDPNDTATVLWEDGFLQVGTRRAHICRAEPSRASRRRCIGDLGSGFATARELLLATKERTVWDCAKRGDVEGCLRLIVDGTATPNDPEPLELDGVAYAGRSALYWACFCGHTRLVEALLERGGRDDDGTCFLAVTSAERADDDRDILFDPDANLFSDNVDYTHPSSSTKAEASSSDVIRRLLVVHAAKTEAGGPLRLYRVGKDGECCVCSERDADAVASPCGHVACCEACLTKLRDNREGCPICRARIRTIARAARLSG